MNTSNGALISSERTAELLEDQRGRTQRFGMRADVNQRQQVQSKHFSLKENAIDIRIDGSSSGLGLEDTLANLVRCGVSSPSSSSCIDTLLVHFDSSINQWGASPASSNPSEDWSRVESLLKDYYKYLQQTDTLPQPGEPEIGRGIPAASVPCGELRLSLENKGRHYDTILTMIQSILCQDSVIPFLFQRFTIQGNPDIPCSIVRELLIRHAKSRHCGRPLPALQGPLIFHFQKGYMPLQYLYELVHEFNITHLRLSEVWIGTNSTCHDQSSSSSSSSAWIEHYSRTATKTSRIQFYLSGLSTPEERRILYLLAQGTSTVPVEYVKVTLQAVYHLQELADQIEHRWFQHDMSQDGDIISTRTLEVHFECVPTPEDLQRLFQAIANNGNVQRLVLEYLRVPGYSEALMELMVASPTKNGLLSIQLDDECDDTPFDRGILLRNCANLVNEATAGTKAYSTMLRQFKIFPDVLDEESPLGQFIDSDDWDFTLIKALIRLVQHTLPYCYHLGPSLSTLCKYGDLFRDEEVQLKRMWSQLMVQLEANQVGLRLLCSEQSHPVPISIFPTLLARSLAPGKEDDKPWTGIFLLLQDLFVRVR